MSGYRKACFILAIGLPVTFILISIMVGWGLVVAGMTVSSPAAGMWWATGGAVGVFTFLLCIACDGVWWNR